MFFLNEYLGVSFIAQLAPAAWDWSGDALDSENPVCTLRQSSRRCVGRELSLRQRSARIRRKSQPWQRRLQDVGADILLRSFTDASRRTVSAVGERQQDAPWRTFPRRNNKRCRLVSRSWWHAGLQLLAQQRLRDHPWNWMHQVPERQRLAELLAGEQRAASAFYRDGTFQGNVKIVFDIIILPNFLYTDRYPI